VIRSISKISLESIKLTARQRRAIPLVLAAKSIEEGCRAATITPVTWYAWLKNEGFKAVVEAQERGRRIGSPQPAQGSRQGGRRGHDQPDGRRREEHPPSGLPSASSNTSSKQKNSRTSRSVWGGSKNSSRRRRHEPFEQWASAP